ncbi:MAG: hypothetical protein WC725_00495 [Patescibacteria group bacterium]|jgi:hypothetical protein
MRVKNHDYIRTTSVEYNQAVKLVSTTFINETFRMLYKFGKFPKLDIRTIDERCGKVDMTAYIKSYGKCISSIKSRLYKLTFSPVISVCIAYNNKPLLDDFEKIKYSTNKKRNNNVFRSLNFFISRATFDATYGGLFGFYSHFRFVSSHNVSFNKKLLLFSEKNRLDVDSVKISKSNVFSLNPTIVISENYVMYFRYKKNEEEVIKVHSKEVVRLFKKLASAKSNLISLDDLENAIKLTGIRKNFDNKYYLSFVSKLIDLGLIKRDPISVKNKLFKNRSFDIPFEAKSIRGIKDEKHSIYDLYNVNNVYVENSLSNEFKASTSIYLNLLNQQLQSIHNEKVYLGNILRQYLKNINKDRCGLLDFVVVFKDEILNLKKSRANNSFSFYEKFLNEINTNKKAEEVQFKNIFTQKSEVKSDLEFYLSVCKINNKNRILINCISPSGVLSSRFDYILKSKRTIFHRSMYEPIEVIFEPQNINLFHSFRRNKYTKYFLNINCNLNNLRQEVINANSICLTIGESGLPVLFSPETNMFFDPVVHSTLSAEHSIILVFLRMISRCQEEIDVLPRLLPDRVKGLNYIPRVVVENLIISKRIWKIELVEINIINGSIPKYNEYLYLMNYFKVRKIPRFVTVFSPLNEKQKFLDLYNPFAFLLFKKYKNEKYIFFEEMMPSPNNVSDFDEKNKHFNQYFFTHQIS